MVFPYFLPLCGSDRPKGTFPGPPEASLGPPRASPEHPTALRSLPHLLRGTSQAFPVHPRARSRSHTSHEAWDLGSNCISHMSTVVACILQGAHLRTTPRIKNTSFALPWRMQVKGIAWEGFAIVLNSRGVSTKTIGGLIRRPIVFG